MKKDPVVYIGYDEREKQAFEVCVESIRRHERRRPITIIPLRQDALRRSGLYFRSHFNRMTETTQKYDVFDCKPFSTDFSFTRFLVPALNQYEGMAIFMDCDMMLRSDIWEVFNWCETDQPLYTVHHDYKPVEGSKKMDGVRQENYNKKNWSSFMVFDCGHPANLNLTPHDVSTKDGGWLHSFKWLDSDYDIGYIPSEWNWLCDWSSDIKEAKNVHFTEGGPWFKEWSTNDPATSRYATEWQKLSDELTYNEAMDI